MATYFGVEVLLTKGPGAVQVAPVPERLQCVDAAFDLVTWYLGSLAGAYHWVDYSGYTVDVATPIESALKLVPTNPVHWEADGIHISCDRNVYNKPTCVTISAANRPKLGSIARPGPC